MILRQTLDKPTHGYWDGGAKSIFDWSIEGSPATGSKGQYVRVGSWRANHWFHVAIGKTVKLTLANARRRLLASMRRQGITGRFEYITELDK
mgnify:CR=1 FL=1